MKHVDYNTLSYTVVNLLGREVLFTDYRVKRNTLPDGIFAYSIRHCDEDWGEPATLEISVVVNYYGCILTDKEFDKDLWVMNGDLPDYIDIEGKLDMPPITETIDGKDVVDFFKK